MKYLSTGFATIIASPVLAHPAPAAHLHTGSHVPMLLGIAGIIAAVALYLMKERKLRSDAD